MKFMLSTHLASHNLKPSDIAISDTIYLAHFRTYKNKNTNHLPSPFTSPSLSIHSPLPLDPQKR